MLGRTKLNYGFKDGLITINDIDYMFNIINSELSEEEKATKLYSFCNEHSILNNVELYSRLKLKEAEKLNELIRIYRDYEKKGLFKKAKNPYKCTSEEIKLRLDKINIVYEIINSNMSDYNKVEQLLSLFKNAEQFRKSFSLFVKFGKNDERLESGRKALNNFDYLYSKFKEYEDKGIVDNVSYYLSIKNYLESYKYAKFIISNYVESPESYKEYYFLEELGIDKDILKYCASIIEFLDIDLYNKYLKKIEINNKIRCFKNKEAISNLARGIETGYLQDGTEFDLLEFIKRVPFKRSNNFIFVIRDFMTRNNKQEMNIIMNYIYENKLHTPLAFQPLDLKSVYRDKYYINGVEIKNSDNDIVLDYLRLNQIPLISKTYFLALQKYLNGEITAEMVKNQKSKRLTFKTLIPGI